MSQKWPKNRPFLKNGDFWLFLAVRSASSQKTADQSEVNGFFGPKNRVFKTRFLGFLSILSAIFKGAFLSTRRV